MVRFETVELRKSISCSFELLNKTDSHAAFKVYIFISLYIFYVFYPGFVNSWRICFRSMSVLVNACHCLFAWSLSFARGVEL